MPEGHREGVGGIRSCSRGSSVACTAVATDRLCIGSGPLQARPALDNRSVLEQPHAGFG